MRWKLCPAECSLRSDDNRFALSPELPDEKDLDRDLRAIAGGGILICPHCGIGHLRRSKLQVGDLLRLVLLQFPVRCSVCAARFHLGRGAAMHLPRSSRKNSNAGTPD